MVKLMRRRKKSGSAPMSGQVVGEKSPRDRIVRACLGRVRDAKVNVCAWGIILVGLLAVAASLRGEANAAEAGISVGTGLALAGFVWLMERHLLREVDEVFDEHTAPLRRRVEHLETLQDLQDAITADREALDSTLTATVRERPDFESTAELLERAQDQQLFGDLRLRGGGDPEILISLTWENFAGFLHENYPDFDPDVLEENPHFNQHIMIRAVSSIGEEPSAASEWWPTQSVEQAWKDFLDSCERGATPTTDIDIRSVFEALAASYWAMIDARRSPLGDPRRLQGRLVLLVNEQWAITTAGLESRMGDYCARPPLGNDEHCPKGHDGELWQEAIFYARLLDDSQTEESQVP